MTIKHASFHEREDKTRKPKRQKHKDDRNLRNALRSGDVDALLDMTDDSFDEFPEIWDVGFESPKELKWK